MADPVFDEERIAALLTAPIGPQTSVPILQNACLMALMDLYDRKAERDYFAKHAVTILSTYAMLSRTWMLLSMSELYDSGNLTSGSFNKAQAEIIELVKTNVEQILGMVRQLQECPTSQDTVN